MEHRQQSSASLTKKRPLATEKHSLQSNQLIMALYVAEVLLHAKQSILR